MAAVGHQRHIILTVDSLCFLPNSNCSLYEKDATWFNEDIVRPSRSISIIQQHFKGKCSAHRFQKVKLKSSLQPPWHRQTKPAPFSISSIIIVVKKEREEEYLRHRERKKERRKRQKEGRDQSMRLHRWLCIPPVRESTMAGCKQLNDDNVVPALYYTRYIAIQYNP